MRYKCVIISIPNEEVKIMTREEVMKSISGANKHHKESIGFNACRINGFLFISDEYDFDFTEVYLEITHKPTQHFQLIAYYNIEKIS